MARRRFIRGIRDKLLFSFSLLIAAIAVFIFVFFPARLRDQAMHSVVIKAAAIRDMTAYGLSAPVYFGDRDGVNAILAGAARTQDVTFVIVHDTAGQVVGSTGTVPLGTKTLVSDSGSLSADGRTYVTSTGVFLGRARLGSLTVGISLTGLRAEIASAQRLGAFVGALILLVGFAAVFAISLRVTRPLTAVAQTVNDIAAGDLSLRADESSDVEIARFVQAFNRMVDSLATAQSELSRSNQRLEVHVDERTAELRTAMAEQRNIQGALTQSEAAARATSETLQSLIDVAPQAIVAVDLAWRVTRWNRAAERLFGWTRDEVLGKPIPYIPAEHVNSFHAFQLLVGSGASVQPEEVVRTRKDGTPVNVLVAASILRERNQQPVGYISIVTDLTDRRTLEEQLRQSQKMEAIGRLAGGVAHDFNNLLTVITSYAALLQDELTSDGEREDLAQISAAASRAAALTRQLLMFSRKEIVQLKAVDVNAIVQNMGPMLRRLLRENVLFTTALGGTVGCVVADPTQLEQVIMNLVVNAADAMPDGGSLSVVTSSALFTEARAGPGTNGAEYVQLLVRDTGIGMDAATIAKVFEPFFTTKDAGHGTGLGLATTYAIITQLGGFIDVKSEVGLGTTFTISLPRGACDASTLRALPEAAGGSTPLESATVLLVEDDAVVRRAIRRGLQKSGFAVLEAADGEAGLAIALDRGQAIDLLVTDLMMPGMNGRELSNEVAKVHPHMKVVFISGYADDTVDRHGLVDRHHAYLQKPFTPGRLRTTIRELIGAAPAAGSAVAQPA